jgi:parvulin-like peptidyl-prolyl isomerase
VFDQKPGETSQLITTPNGYLVYKVGEKDILPLDRVREEISSTLVSQRFQDSLQTIQQSATPELNERYFTEAPATTPQGADAGKGTPQAPAQPPASGPK